jgi:preprotein translocase subunit SecE
MAKETTVDTKPAKAPKTKVSQPAKPGIFARLSQYLRDVRSEMRRVVWPQRPEVVNSSVVVVVTLVFFVAFTFVVDSIVVELLRLVTRLG